MYVSTHLYNMYEASPPSRPYCVSTIFHSSLFTKRKCNSHSSFYILHSSFFILHSSFFIFHSSFFILHSSFKKSPSVGRVTARYFPHFFAISIDSHQRKGKYRIFFEKISPKVLVVQKKAVPLHSLSGKRYC